MDRQARPAESKLAKQNKINIDKKFLFDYSILMSQDIKFFCSLKIREGKLRFEFNNIFN